MGLFSFTLTGGSLILIGAWESLSSSPFSPPSILPKTPTKSLTPTHKMLRFSMVTLISIAFLSLFFIFDAILSVMDAVRSQDKMGYTLQLQGTWFIQMGLSFFTSFIAHNCSLHHKSRGNYTIRCNGHKDSHRGGAIAVLLFNCYLALLVALISGVYSIVSKRYTDVDDYRNYKHLGGDAKGIENQARFTLDSNSDDGGNDDIKQEEGNIDVLKRENGTVELAMNGQGGVQR
ncbi:hypothetical protein Cgig2_013577 [Carnegiea gigantea]|uniref:Uncharacterized protein n=1 Tax=Carnegiea gigantea TaxID=171969 RepID=A0A9Q1QGU6_9CARY|nr:hypothetical protein Cgig2_013577 [Carnegiea gigantea]